MAEMGPPAPVVGHDGELACQKRSDFGVVARVAGHTADEQDCGTRSADLVIDVGPVDPHRAGAWGGNSDGHRASLLFLDGADSEPL